MLTYTNYRSFAEVVAHYDSITPLRGSTNAGKDIRPIGDRRRKYERIVKISNNCYALSDGYHFGDEHFGYWYHGQHFTPTPADMEKYAPIVWRKKRDGTEEVTLRNGWGPSTHVNRYNFLYRHSPRYMLFQIRNGKHFIETGRNLPGTENTRYYLAKTTTMPKVMHNKTTNNQYYNQSLPRAGLQHVTTTLQLSSYASRAGGSMSRVQDAACRKLRQSTKTSRPSSRTTSRSSLSGVWLCRRYCRWRTESTWAYRWQTCTRTTSRSRLGKGYNLHRPQPVPLCVTTNTMRASRCGYSLPRTAPMGGLGTRSI